VGASLDWRVVSSTGWLAFDVTGWVSQQSAGNRLVSFMVMDPSQSNKMARFDSREASGNMPALEVK
jgi:hypothetical protein